jgi:glycosyltransferase involved in cell wall biosynthesis
MNIYVRFYDILNAIRIFKPDIIHSHQPKALLFGGICAKFLNIPHVITIHSKAIDHSLLHNFPKNWLIRIGHSIINYASQFLASKIIFVNHTMLRESFFRSKSTCIYNWLSPIHIKVDHPRRITQAINILSVGSISVSKGTDLLLDLFDMIICDPRANKYTITLDIVGTGETEFVKSIIKRASSKLLTGVNFHGYQNNLYDFYRNATCFMLLSRSETFGLVYVEAMNYGLPIFSLNIDILKEIVPDWNFKFDNLDILKERFFELICSSSLHQEIGVRNIEYASVKFSYIKSMQETRIIYEELL